MDRTKREGYVEKKPLRSRGKRKAFAEFDPLSPCTEAFFEEFVGTFCPSCKKRLVYRFLKRSFDFCFSFMALVFFLPFFVIIAVAVKLDSKGPILFRQKRVGKGGKLFTCLKFRTMITSAPKDVATAKLEHPEQYITRVGMFLRRYSLDELPQLFCCLVGTMSLIGARPLVAGEKELNTIRERLGVFAMRPGLSGYAQVSGRDELCDRNKVILDALYVKNASLWWDFCLMLRSVAVSVTKKGNFSEKLLTKKKKLPRD